MDEYGNLLVFSVVRVVLNVERDYSMCFLCLTTASMSANRP